MSDLVFYDIEDYETGKRYRVEAYDTEATYDEAVEWLSGLSDEERATYEYTPPETAEPEGQRPVSGDTSGPISVSVSMYQDEPQAPTPWSSSPGYREEYSIERVSRNDVAAYMQRLYDAGERDPEVFNNVFREFVGEPSPESRVTLASIAAAERRDEFYRRHPNIPFTGHFIATDFTGRVAPEAPDNIVEAGLEGARRGLQNMANTTTGAAAVLADVVGADETAESLANNYLETQAKINLYNPRAVGTVRDIESAHDAALYAADSVGEFVPQLTATMGMGFAGRAAAAPLANRVATRYTERMVARGVAQEVAEAEARRLANRIVAGGTVAGVVGSSTAQETGAIYGDTYGATGERAPWMSLAAGLSAGALEAIVPGRLTAKMTGEMGQQWARTIAREVGEGFVTEGATEALQTFIEQLPASVINGDSPFTWEMYLQMEDAFIRGGIGGGVMQGSVAATEGRQARRAPTPLEPLDQTITMPTTTDRRTVAYRQEAQQAVRDAEYVVDEVSGNWTNRPNTEVLMDFQSLPGVDNDALGVYGDDGTVRLNLSAIHQEAQSRGVSTDDMIRSVLFHEALGHHGLASEYGAELDNFLDAIYERGSNDFRQAVNDWVAANSGAYTRSPNVNAAWTPEAQQAEHRKWQRIRATEELLAETSENGLMPVPVKQAIINFFKKWARRLGWNMAYSDNEIRALLGVAQRNTVSGAPNAGGASTNRFAVTGRLSTWHGTPSPGFAPTANNPLGEFDHSFMGKGEGVQVYGWGSYLSDSQGIASGRYRDGLGGVNYSVSGVTGDSWTLRDAAWRKAPEGMSDALIEAAVSRRLQGVGAAPVTGKSIYEYLADAEDFRASTQDPSVYQSIPEQHRAELEAAAEWVNKTIQATPNGSLYNVELPEGMNWLEWEDPVTDQPELRKAIEAHGYVVSDYVTWNTVNRAAADARMEYQRLNERLQRLDKSLNPEDREMHIEWLMEDPRPYGIDEDGPISRERAEAFYEARTAELEERAEKTFQELQLAAVKRQKAIDLANRYVHEDMAGGDVYEHLATTHKDGARGASLMLESEGINGNRFLADNYRENRPRANDGTDVFNYVVFNEGNTNITGKYMKPSKGRYMDAGVTARNDNVTPYGKDRKGKPTLPGRVMSHEEYSRYSDDMAQYYKNQAARWINRNENLYNKRLEQARRWEGIAQESREKAMRYLNGTEESRSVRPVTRETVIDTQRSIDPEHTPANDRYMRPSKKPSDTTPVREEDLTPDELFESLNAFENLDRIVSNYDAPVISFEELTEQLALRGVTPSEMLRRNPSNPGDLTRRMFMYDIAARKLDEKLSKLNAKINSGMYTMRDKDEYLKTINRFTELTNEIFKMQSEAGRMLRAVQDQAYTRKKMTTLRDMLADVGNGMEGLDDPETFQKFARAVQHQLTASRQTGADGKTFTSVLNLPRALMSSYDLSAPLRQGLFFINHWKYWTGFLQMFGYYGSQATYDVAMREIAARDNYGRMLEAGLAFSTMDGALTSREESFQTDLATKIPVIGVGVQASERAYTGFLNKLRADMFDQFLKYAERSGQNIDDPELLKGLARFVNAGTGRGNIPELLRSASPQLNALFFSPRLMASRMQLLWPGWYLRLPPGIRHQAIISAASFGTIAMMVLSLIGLMWPDEVEVEYDPRASDFAKVRVGDTRYDILGGFGQYITLGARIATGQRMSGTGNLTPYRSVEDIMDLQEIIRGSASLEQTTTDGGPYEPTLLSAFGDFSRNKSSPNMSYAIDMMTGEDAIGNPVDPVDSLVQRMTPLYVQDVSEAMEEFGTSEGLFRVMPGLFGVGVNTYVTRSLDPEQELEAPITIKDQDIADGSNEWVSFEDGVGTLSPVARDTWYGYLNSYFSQIIEWEMSQVDWESLEPSEQAEIISDARTEARREARKDMLTLIGVN